MSKQPEALRLFTHQLLDHEGKPNGVHIGVTDINLLRRSHVDGETSSAIHEWVDAAELRRLHAQCDELLKALQLAIETIVAYGEEVLEDQLESFERTKEQV